MEPLKPEVRLSPSTTVAASPVPPRRANAAVSHTGAGEVRSYTAGKERGTRLSPVKSQPSSEVITGSVSGSSGPSRIVSSRSSNSTIRSRADTKSRPSNTQPIRSQPTKSRVIQSTPRHDSSLSLNSRSGQQQSRTVSRGPVNVTNQHNSSAQRSRTAAPARQAQRPSQPSRQSAPRSSVSKSNGNRSRSSSPAKSSTRASGSPKSEKRR